MIILQSRTLRLLWTIAFLLLRMGAIAQQKVSTSTNFPKKFREIEVSPLVFPDSAGWKLLFEDEFNGNAPDEGKWNLTPPWGAVFVFGNKARNDSSQNGTVECSDPRNVVVSNGTVKLLIKEEETIARSSYDKNDSFLQPDGLPCKRVFHYSSGCLYSKQKFGPGKFEIRCKIPKIDGVWPAFWLFGGCAQEFDVFEFLNGKYEDATGECSRRLQMTYHRYSDCKDPNTWCSHGTSVLDTLDYSRDFHTYSVEWDQYQITWKVDGEVKKVTYGLRHLIRNKPVDERKVKRKRRYRLFEIMPFESEGVNIIVSCGVTNYGNALHPLTRGNYPAVFEIDYVRAWGKQ